MENTKSSEVKSEIQLGEQLKTQMILIKEYMKNEFNSDDELPLNKRIKIPNMIIIVRGALHENEKNYPNVLLDECLNKL